MDTAILGGSFFVTLFLIALALAWIVMPFAIIGTKPLLRELIEEQQKTNELLRMVHDRQQAMSRAAEAPRLTASP